MNQFHHNNIRDLRSLLGLAVALALGALPNSLRAACTDLGLGGSMGVLTTNCLGGPSPLPFAHLNDFVRISITARHNNSPDAEGDNCGFENVVLTNQTIFNPCTGLTSSNLVGAAWSTCPGGTMVAGRFPELHPFPQPVLGCGQCLLIATNAQGCTEYTPAYFPNGITFIAQVTCPGTIVYSSKSEGRITNAVKTPIFNGLHVEAGSTATLTVINPRICVGKTCSTNGVGDAVVITYVVGVTNCGDIGLDNVYVSNFFNVVPAGHANGELIVSNIFLAPNEFRVVTGNYLANCTTTNDTVIAAGNDPLLCTVRATNSATCPISCAPAIKVYKQVVCFAPGGCEPFSPDLNSQKQATGVVFNATSPTLCPAFCYRITVTNIGNVALNNLQLTDVGSPDANLPVAACGLNGITLPVGGSTNCFVPLANVTHCRSHTNIVTATAVGASSSGNQTVSSQDTNRVTVIPINIECVLQVSTNGVDFITTGANCPEVLLGNSYTVRLTVRNSGQYPLANVFATNTGSGLCFGSPLSIGNLAVGASFVTNCSFTCTTPGTNRFSVSVVGEASQALGHICAFTSNGVPVRATSSCDTCVVCSGIPAIKVYKQVVCYTPGGCEPFSPDLNLQKQATGVVFNATSPALCPAFCYRITVTNVGTVPLSNLQITDVGSPDANLPVAACGLNGITLPVGGSTNCFVPLANVTHCRSHTNIVTATAVGASSSGNQTVSSQDTNRVIVIPINIECTLEVSTNGGVSFITTGADCPQVIIGNSYIVRLTVRNTGQYPLANVFATNTGAALCFTSPLSIGNLAVGGSFTTNCPFTCTTVGTNRYSVSISGEASQAFGHVCAFTSNGVPVRATSSCNACVACGGCPHIKVTKGVACVIPNPQGGILCGSANGQYNHEAFGVRSATAEPAFCYQITVTNNGQITLYNVCVTDDHFGVLTSGLTLGVNEGRVFYLQTNWAGIPADSSQTKTVLNTVRATGGCSQSATCTGNGGCDLNCPGAGTDGGVRTDGSGLVASTNSALVHIKPASIVCVKLVSVNGGAPASTFSGEGIILTNIVWSAWITNTGQAYLTNVLVTESTSCDRLSCDDTIRVPGILAPGAAIGPIYLCTNVFAATECVNTNIHNCITVSAEAASLGTNCVWDINGSNVTARTTCDATVKITCPKAGCTPGFWKNCTIHWGPTGYRTDQSVRSVFGIGSCCTSLGDSSLLGALSFQGGSGTCGGAQILLRAAVAALLNGSSPEVDYPFTGQEVITMVTAALQSCNRDTMITLASELDRDNNLGCTGANGEGLPCHRLSDFPRVAPTRPGP